MGALVGEPRLPTTPAESVDEGGEFGPESGVLLQFVKAEFCFCCLRCNMRSCRRNPAGLILCLRSITLCFRRSFNKFGSDAVLRSGKSDSYFRNDDGGCGILYGWELVKEPAGNDSPDELFTTPLFL